MSCVVMSHCIRKWQTFSAAPMILVFFWLQKLGKYKKFCLIKQFFIITIKLLHKQIKSLLSSVFIVFNEDFLSKMCYLDQLPILGLSAFISVNIYWIESICFSLVSWEEGQPHDFGIYTLEVRAHCCHQSIGRYTWGSYSTWTSDGFSPFYHIFVA